MISPYPGFKILLKSVFECKNQLGVFERQTLNLAYVYVHMIQLFYPLSQLGIDGDILTAFCWSWSKDLVSLLSGLVVKLWMPLSDVKQTSLMVSGFQAKVLLQCPMLFKAMI